MLGWCELMIKSVSVYLTQISVNTHSEGMLISFTFAKIWTVYLYGLPPQNA